MNGGLPKAAKLASGKFELIPSKTEILNPELEGQAQQFYFVWATTDKDKASSDLPTAIEDASISLFGWFSNDAFFLQHVYDSTPEVMKCIGEILEKIKPSKGAFVRISFMKSEFMSAGRGLVAGVELELE